MPCNLLKNSQPLDQSILWTSELRANHPLLNYIRHLLFSNLVKCLSNANIIGLLGHNILNAVQRNSFPLSAHDFPRLQLQRLSTVAYWGGHLDSFPPYHESFLWAGYSYWHAMKIKWLCKCYLMLGIAYLHAWVIEWNNSSAFLQLVHASCQCTTNFMILVLMQPISVSMYLRMHVMETNNFCN